MPTQNRSVHSLLFLAVALVASGGAAEAQVLTQSVNNTSITGGSACLQFATGYHWEHSFLRSYDLSAYVSGSIDVTCIRFGVSGALAGPTQVPAGTQPAEIRLYQDPGGVFPTSIPGPPVHAEAFRIPDTPLNDPRIVVLPMSTVTRWQPTDRLIVEYYVPNGVPTMDKFLPGANSLGETAPGYTWAPVCAGGAIVPYASVSGINGLHVIIDVVFAPAGQPAPMTVSANVQAPNPLTGMTAFTLTNSGLTPGNEIWNLYSVDLCPGGVGTGPILGLCFSNLNDLWIQLQMPIGVAPLHYTATSCIQDFGPFTLPAGLSLELVLVDFDSTTGILNAWSPVTQVNL